MFRRLCFQVERILLEGYLLLLLVALLKPQDIDDPALRAYLPDPLPHPSDLMQLQVGQENGHLRDESLRQDSPHEGDPLVIGSCDHPALIVELNEHPLPHQDIAVLLGLECLRLGVLAG